jgi:hypothetical protein
MSDGGPDHPHHPDHPDRDELPADLDVTAAYAGAYTFPDVRRRRIAAVIVLAGAAACAALFVTNGNGGLLGGALALGAVGGYQLACAWPLRVDQTEALAIAARAVGFPVGHSSARVMFRGLRSRPVWQVLLYSADEPPSIRGLVELDAVGGAVLGEYTEHNPEDWSAFSTGPGSA